MVECPECGGKGVFCYAYDIDNNKDVVCTKSEYDLLPETEEEARLKGEQFIKGEQEVCENCDGAGVVEYEPDYEPDYDE